LSDETVGLILAVGTNLSEWSTAGWDKVLMNDRLVHVHNHSSAYARSPMASLHVLGTISTIFEELILKLDTQDRDGGLFLREKETDKQILTLSYPASGKDDSSYVPGQIEVQAPDACLLERASGAIKPQLVISEIIQRLPPETCFFVDNSNSVPWTIHYFFHHRPENYHLSVGFASMGWAIGASVGAALGAPYRAVVCLTGDGCFLMSGLEITVAVAEKLPVIFVVLNDRAYGMIRHAHRLTGKEPVDFANPAVDFCMMARAVGAEAYTIRRPEDLVRIDFAALCEKDLPTLLDVHIDPDEPPPLGMF
jgi:acetolactate synthase-1/2/3 large subunit